MPRQRKRRPRGAPMTVFGDVVVRLAMSRGIETNKALADLLQSHGYPFRAASFSDWLYGHYTAPKVLPAALAEVLDLDEGERARLADAFTYGQNVLITRKDLGIPEDDP